VSPEERDRWKAYLSQILGKPKAAITLEDWDERRKSWKIPSLISTTLDCGWRACMVGRLSTSLIDLDRGQIDISPQIAVKNNKNWTAELSDRSIQMISRWLEQRSNQTKYDESDKIWLNRKGNDYNSRNLNDLLSNLIEEADISTRGRQITWHSIRHSTGMYVYSKTKDLGMVAEILRHASIESARQYAHPTPESKKNVIESI
jgi:integrase